MQQESVQHAAVQAGIEWPKPRFDFNEDTVNDRLSGLTWTRNASYSKNFISWEDAGHMIQQMNAKMDFGFNDWRIPHIRELESLIDLAMHSPALPAISPLPTYHDFYWSSTTSHL
jgi:hypothetical protein